MLSATRVKLPKCIKKKKTPSLHGANMPTKSGRTEGGTALTTTRNRDTFSYSLNLLINMKYEE